MTDLSPDFDFTAATNAAIAEAEGTEPETTEETDAASEKEAAAAEQTEAAETAPETEVAPDPAVELETLRQRLADKDAFIDRQGNEIGELRKAFEDRVAGLEQQIATPQQRVTEELIDRDPAAATKLAFAQGDGAAAAVAFAAWKDEDPANAGAWVAYTAAQNEMAQLREQNAQDLAALEARVAPLAAHNADQATAQRVHAVADKYGADEINAFAQSEAFAQLAEEFSWAQTGLVDDPAGTLESLFLVHRGRTADTLNRTVEDVARETAESAAQATSDAYVASASQATSTTAEQKTEAELIAEEMTARIQHRDSVWAGGWDRGTS